MPEKITADGKKYIVVKKLISLLLMHDKVITRFTGKDNNGLHILQNVLRIAYAFGPYRAVVALPSLKIAFQNHTLKQRPKVCISILFISCWLPETGQWTINTYPSKILANGSKRFRLNVTSIPSTGIRSNITYFMKCGPCTTCFVIFVCVIYDGDDHLAI